MIEAIDDRMPVPTRTTCMKCGDKLPGDASGERCWCSTCRYILRRPDPPHPRYNATPPAQSVLVALGYGVPFDDRQRAEEIPSGRYAEQWYDPDEPEYDPAAKFSRLFNRSPLFAA